MEAGDFPLADYSLISSLALQISRFCGIFSETYLQPERLPFPKPSADLAVAFYSIFICHCFEEFCSGMCLLLHFSKTCLLFHVVQLNQFAYTVSLSVSFLHSF